MNDICDADEETQAMMNTTILTTHSLGLVRGIGHQARAWPTTLLQQSHTGLCK